jgi:hypothetical protein
MLQTESTRCSKKARGAVEEPGYTQDTRDAYGTGTVTGTVVGFFLRWLILSSTNRSTNTIRLGSSHLNPHSTR